MAAGAGAVRRRLTWSRLKIFRIIAHHHQTNTIGGMALRGSPAILMMGVNAMHLRARATNSKVTDQAAGGR